MRVQKFYFTLLVVYTGYSASQSLTVFSHCFCRTEEVCGEDEAFQVGAVVVDFAVVMLIVIMVVIDPEEVRVCVVIPGCLRDLTASLIDVAQASASPRFSMKRYCLLSYDYE